MSKQALISPCLLPPNQLQASTDPTVLHACTRGSVMPPIAVHTGSKAGPRSVHAVASDGGAAAGDST